MAFVESNLYPPAHCYAAYAMQTARTAHYSKYDDEILNDDDIPMGCMRFNLFGGLRK